jgi:hypothetical protein
MNDMTKTVISKLWIAGLVAIVAGLIVGGVSLGLMLANGGSYVPAASGNGYDFVPRLDNYFWTTIGFMVVGFTVVAGGGIAQLVAWIGALVNTYPLADRTWFVVLLAGGLVGLAFGLVQFAVMIAYIIAGPDGAHERQPQLPMQAPSQSLRSSTLTPTG